MDADWLLIAVRFALFVVLGVLFGLSAFGFYNRRLGKGDEASVPGSWFAGAAIVGLLLSTVGLSLLAAQMAGTSPWAINRDAIATILSETAIGTAWLVRATALIVTALAASMATKSSARLALVALGSAIALSSLSWAGHGAMDEGVSGWVHLAADTVHLIAAGAWVGALFGLLLLVARPLHQIDAPHLRLTHGALAGFSTVGTIIVGTIVVTGLTNAWMLVGPSNLPALGSSLYGQLLLAKLMLFAAMLGLASLNRFKFTPAIERSIAARDHAGAIAALRLSLAAEAGCAIAIMALVAWLGTLEPPVSMNL